MKDIVIRGAKVHNLKNIDVTIPRDKLVVITGLSGSGKSSLAFDTIYAEGQRRYVESLSAYARQFLGMMDKPDVEQIEGLSPAISIDQKSTSRNPRSTVGTITEIYDYLRLLYARVGVPYDPKTGKKLKKQTKQEILEQIQKLPDGTKIQLISPLIIDKKGEHKGVLQEAQRAGYVRVRIDGTIMPIEEALDMDIDKKKKHSIDVVVDRLEMSKEIEDRLADSLETALDLGNGTVVVNDVLSDSDYSFSENFATEDGEYAFAELEPRSFSFNSPHGACSNCTGLGTKLEVDPDLVIPNKKLTIAEGAIRPWSSSASGRQTWHMRILEVIAQDFGFDMNTAIKDLSQEQLNVVLYGTGKKKYKVTNEDSNSSLNEVNASYEGVVSNLERRYKETDSDYIRGEIEKYMRIRKCPTCEGKRLKIEALAVKVLDKTIDQIASMSVLDAYEYFKQVYEGTYDHKFTKKEETIAEAILKEIVHRLEFLHNVGLDYLTIDRAAHTLSGGEAQRIRLATQISSGLVGVVYILDEPSIGLHSRDNDKLIDTLKNLRDLGNSVIVVEHDEATILESDHVIDVGPGAGKNGGQIISQGSPKEIMKDKNSITGKYLSGKEQIEAPKKYREGNGKTLSVIGAQEFNLKNVDIHIPLGKFVCVTGVSGSGKSTLVDDILGRALSAKFHGAKSTPGEHKEIQGMDNINKVIRIDQSPIGRTPRSNPATYTGVFTYIRDLFAATPEARMRGYKAGRFSFNVKGGRCESCQGDGMVKIEMHFLPDVYVQCDICKGTRYNKQALEIHYKGKDISEVLNMSVEEALRFFRSVPALKQKLQILSDVGLGYITLGQSATTLSGGEAQRIKLATELSRRATGKTLYILDEPTTGLHFADVKRLLDVLNRLVDKGNSILVIEHNIDIIKSADHVIDMGPEGGSGGGAVVGAGTPREIAKIKNSYTGKYLKAALK